MIDSLVRLRPRWRGPAWPRSASAGSLRSCTSPPPSNVDEPAASVAFSKHSLRSRTISSCLPVHPRTRDRLARTPVPGVRLVEPMAYLASSTSSNTPTVALTDSGGIRRRKRPRLECRVSRCAIRPNDRSPSVWGQTGSREKTLAYWFRRANVIVKRPCRAEVPLWDGKAAERIVRVLEATSPTRSSHGFAG